MAPSPIATEEELGQDRDCDAVVSSRIVLDDHGFDRIVALIEKPAVPTGALRDLMRRKQR